MSLEGFIEVIKNGEFFATLVATLIPLMPSLVAMLGTISNVKNKTAKAGKELREEIKTLKSQLADTEKRLESTSEKLDDVLNAQKKQIAVLSIMATNSNLSNGTKTEIVKILGENEIDNVEKTVINANKQIEKADTEKVEQSTTLEEIARENEDEIIMG